MTVDPYEPPKSEPSSAAPPRQPSFALRTSIVLAIFGVLVFWIPGVFVFARQGEAASTAAEALLGVGAIASISSHLVGVGVVLAAPRGRRTAGVLANTIPLVILAALMALGSAAPSA
jgi:hypothetical protein